MERAERRRRAECDPRAPAGARSRRVDRSAARRSRARGVERALLGIRFGDGDDGRSGARLGRALRRSSRSARFAAPSRTSCRSRSRARAARRFAGGTAGAASRAARAPRGGAASSVRTQTRSPTRSSPRRRSRAPRRSRTSSTPRSIIRVWLAKHAPRVLADERVRFSQLHLKTKKAWLVHEPLGVVAAITPWNIPFAIPFAAVATAVAAGNAVVVKPSELTPLTAAWVRASPRGGGRAEGSRAGRAGRGGRRRGARRRAAASRRSSSPAPSPWAVVSRRPPVRAAARSRSSSAARTRCRLRRRGSRPGARRRALRGVPQRRPGVRQHRAHLRRATRVRRVRATARASVRASSSSEPRSGR